MATQQELLIKIKGDVADIQAKLNKVQKQVDKTEDSFVSLKKTMVSITKAVSSAIGGLAGAKGFGKLISVGAEYNGEVQQTEFLMGRLDATTQELIKTQAKEAQAMGMTEKQYMDSAASLGSFMNSMGMTAEEVNNLIPKMVQLASDGAAFANVPVDEAMEAISSAAMGNYEALGKLNIEMSDSLINESKYAKELGKTTQQMTLSEKAQAIYHTMLERGNHLTGFAGRESESFSAKLNLTKEKMNEAAGALGEQLLPLFSPFLDKLGAMADKLKDGVEHFAAAYKETGNFADALSDTAEFMGMPWLANFIDKIKEMKDKIGEIPAKLKEWQEPLTMAAILVGALGLAVLAYWVAQNFALITTALGVGAITAWNAVCGIAAGITAVFGAAVAFLSSPITWAILAIGLLVAAGYWLYKNWDEVSAYLVELWNKIKAKAQEIWNGIKEYFIQVWNAIKEKARAVWDSIKEFFSGLWDSIKERATTVWNSVKEYFSGLWDSIKEKAVNAWNNIKQAISDAWNKTVDWVKEKATEMVNFFKDLPGEMLSIGKNIINGLLDGLRSAWNKITSWVEEKANWIKDKFKSILGIHSPSREFMKIGMYVDEGLVKGLEDGEVDVNTQITGMAEGLKSGFNSSFENPNNGGITEAVGANTTINLNGSYMFQDKDSMDYFMNKLALAVQRG